MQFQQPGFTGDKLRSTLSNDLIAGLVVFLVSVPLCLGVALASGAPLFSGLIAGILGGVLVGVISGSHTSVSGPSPALTTIVAAQILALGSFQAFTLAVLISGLIQIVLGTIRAGGISAFVPSSVINGLLRAIGIILILKQIPHILGHDTDPEGEMSFLQPDKQTTFSEFGQLINDLHPGAAVIGIASVVILIYWDHNKKLRQLKVPPQLVVVLMGILVSQVFNQIGSPWSIESSHLVQVPVANGIGSFFSFLTLPDFSRITDPAIYFGAFLIAVVTSLETLLNLEAVDKIDPEKRHSPANRELIAQGIGNMTAGLIGGIPISSVIVRSKLNIDAGNKTKTSTLIHGLLILVSLMLFPQLLNAIPISALAGILFVTGYKLASPHLFVKIWNEGYRQFLPFLCTVVAIVLTDLLVGIIIGMIISLGFILHSNLKRPLKIVRENHIGGEVLHIHLAEQVSFLNKASIEKTLDDLPPGSHALINAKDSTYIDPDIISMLKEFVEYTAPVHGVKVSLEGFRDRYAIDDRIQFIDYSTQELQSQMTPVQVLEVLMDGNERFRTDQRLRRDLTRQTVGSSQGQHPLAVILSCIDSRSPAELIFDLGLGDIFSIRVAGNIVGKKILGSMEYATEVAGAKLIMVLGHSQCGAVTAAIQLKDSEKPIAEVTGCQHLDDVISRIEVNSTFKPDMAPEMQRQIINQTIRENVIHSVKTIMNESETIQKLVAGGKIAIVGAVYHVASGKTELLEESFVGIKPEMIRSELLQGELI